MKRLFGVSVCIMCLLAGIAANADSVTYNPSDANVSFVVEDTGRATAYADKTTNTYFYAKEIDSENGKIIDNFRIPEDIASGEYKISVVADSGETEIDIRHINLTQAATGVNAIIAATTANDIKTAINTYIADLGISATDFTTYGNAVCEHLATADESAYVDATDNQKVVNFWYDYHAALLLAKTTGQTVSYIDNLLKTEAVYMGFDYEAFSSYFPDVDLDGFPDASGVYTKLATGDMTETDISNILDIWVGLEKLNSCGNATYYQTLLITDYASLFGIDTSKFTASNKQPKIISDIMNGSTNGYATAADVVSAYNTAIINNPNTEGGSGGGGGGGGAPAGPNSSDKGDSTVAIPINPVPEDNREKVFDDVDNKHWARDIIAELKERGIVSGTDGKFKPNDNISRAEFSTMIAQCFYKGETPSGSVSFVDVNKLDWFYTYTILLAERGIVNGVGDGKFSPKSMITREDMAVIAVRCLASKIDITETDILAFNDASRISEYARTAVATLVGEKILSGTPEGMFYPKNNLTRAEAAVVVYKLLHRLEA